MHAGVQLAPYSPYAASSSSLAGVPSPHSASPPVGAEPKRRARPSGGAGTGSAAAVAAAGITIAKGPGLPLSDIPLLQKRLEKVSNEDARTKLLYFVCFPFKTEIPDRMAKKTLRLFSGWENDETRQAAERRLIAEFTGDMDTLRKTAKLLDLPVGNYPNAGASDLCDGIAAYLASPEVVIHPVRDEAAIAADAAANPSAGGIGGPAKKRRPPKRPGEAKRPPTAYLLFAAEHRERVAKESPDVPMKEVNRLLGALWSRVDATAKEKYTKASEEAKEIWERDHPELAAAVRAGLPTSGSGRKRKRGGGASTNGATTPGAGPDDGLDDPYYGAHAAGAASEQESEMSDVARSSGASAYPQPPHSGSSHHGHQVAASPSVDRQFALQLQSSIARILAQADITKFSLRNVKQALSQEFSDKVVRSNEQLISKLVDQELVKMPDQP